MNPFHSNNDDEKNSSNNRPLYMKCWMLPFVIWGAKIKIHIKFSYFVFIWKMNYWRCPTTVLFEGKKRHEYFTLITFFFSLFSECGLTMKMMFWNSFGRCENKTISILIQNTSEYDFGYVIQSRHTAWHRTEEGKKDMHKSKHILRIGFAAVYVLIEQSHYMEDAHFRVVWVMNTSIGGNYTFF